MFTEVMSLAVRSTVLPRSVPQVKCPKDDSLSTFAFGTTFCDVVRVESLCKAQVQITSACAEVADIIPIAEAISVFLIWGICSWLVD